MREAILQSPPSNDQVVSHLVSNGWPRRDLVVEKAFKRQVNEAVQPGEMLEARQVVAS